MQTRIRNRWENDGIRLWVVALLGAGWLAFVIMAAGNSSGDRSFAFTRLAESVVFTHYGNSRFPERIVSMTGIDDAAMSADLAEYFDEFVGTDMMPQASLPTWALAFHLLDDPNRAERALSMVGRYCLPEQTSLVRSIVDRQSLSLQTEAWLSERIAKETWELPEWHYVAYVQGDEEVEKWLEDRGSKMIRRGLSAHAGVAIIVAAILCSVVWFLFKRKSLRSAYGRFRLPGNWRVLHLLREFLLAELVAVFIAVGLFFPVYFIVDYDAGNLIAGVLVMLIPPVWLIFRLTPGMGAALRLLGMKRWPWRTSSLAGLGLVGVGLVAVILISITQVLPTADSLPDSLDPASLDRPLAVFSMFVLAVVLAPFSEEIVFRGFLFGGLERKWGSTWAAIVSSLIFSAMHGYSAVGFLVVTIYGLVFCWLFQRSGSLWPGIVAHATVNFALMIEVSSWYSFH